MLFYLENCSYSEFFVLFCFDCFNRFISLSYCRIYQYIDGLWILKFFLHLKFWDVNFRPFVSFKTFVEYRKFYGGFSTLYFLSDMEKKTNPAFMLFMQTSGSRSLGTNTKRIKSPKARNSRAKRYLPNLISFYLQSFCKAMILNWEGTLLWRTALCFLLWVTTNRMLFFSS
jgi:hypothetical protein